MVVQLSAMYDAQKAVVGKCGAFASGYMGTFYKK